MFYQNETTAIFVDGPNFYHSAKALGFDVDYARLKGMIEKQCRLLRATYFTMLVERDEHVAVRPMVDFLQYNGWTVVAKDAREFVDGDGRRRFKGNTDIDMALAAARIATRIHHAVLFTGNQDFCPLVEYLQDQGARVSLVSSIKTEPAMASDELRRKADNFIELSELRPSIERTARRVSAA
ncbi:hypothetical protein RA27_02140 [Ruegeria sp. ANG-R]|uniref:LabA-like NYN domain-containing protein n=1 Tax=Ruegeria sp. ANG-R TaxID=1577903 RepID=UPI00057D0340|nr:NYN domain-containing protein [Ruegeria sp. ANG-R]KIC43402.1 hypothetical protein RA27_02140 [Ruegeria sp. ANG-R]